MKVELIRPYRSSWTGNELMQPGTVLGLNDRRGRTLIDLGIAKHAAESLDFDELKSTATDAAVKLALKHNIDLSQVEGSGKDGRILEKDVEAHLRAMLNEAV